MIRALALVAGLMSAPAFAGPTCYDRQSLVSQLAAEWGETVQWVGIDQDGPLIEIHVNRNTGSFTITVLFPNGMMCVTASGNSFEALRVLDPDA